MMHEDRARAGSFGEDAVLYDRARPSYPAALVDALMVNQPQEVLDVGCGTGIAGRLFADRECRVLGVEPDPRMAAVARRHGLAVECATFEMWEPLDRRFDLLVCGQAWHWVDPDAGAEKATAVLRPGGRIGLFWNQGRPVGDIGPALDEVYRRIAPDLEEYSILLRPLGHERFEAAASGLAATGAFDVPTVTAYAWSRSYTSKEWIDHLMTHSDHRTLPQVPRAALLEEISTAIRGLGGTFRVDYTCWLVTAIRLLS